MTPQQSARGRLEWDETMGEDKEEMPEVESARAEVEHTRHEMSETLDAIRTKLDPAHLAEQAKQTAYDATIGRAQDAVETVVGTTREVMTEAMHTARGAMGGVMDNAKDAGSAVVDTIKANPIPSAMIGIGLGWLLMNARRRATPYQPYTDGGYLDTPTGGYGGYGAYTADEPGIGERVGDAAGQVQQKAGEIAGQVQHKAGEIAGQVQQKAGEVAGRVQAQASELTDRARAQAVRATDGFQTALEENPLAVGAVALGIGAVAALLIPETRKERELMGSARDSLVDRAQHAAQELGQKVQTVAQETISMASDVAREEAGRQGLTAPVEPSAPPAPAI